MKTNREDMGRRDFLKGAAAAAVAGSVTTRAAAQRPKPSFAPGQSRGKPNFLIVVTDQQNIDTIQAHRDYFQHAAHGCNWVRTPNLDRLASQGVTFTESHTPNPVCSPGRSAMFTGRMTSETGVICNNIGIDRDVPNMGQWFNAVSTYNRYYCGKWHAGGMWNYPEITGPRKIPGFDTLPVAARGTGDLADFAASAAASAFLRNYREKDPFLLVVGLMNPHDICYWTDSLAGKVVTADYDPLELREQWPVLPPNHEYDFEEPRPGRYKGFDETRWRNYSYDYYRMVEKVDADVGRLLDAVESRDDDTLIVFTSDHGEGLGRHQRVQKWHPYEESVKVPLIISLPGRFREGVVDQEHLVSGVDLMSTLCDVAEIPAPPHARGRSLRPLLEGQTPAEWRDNVYIEWQHTGRVIRSPQYKFVKYYEFSGDYDKPFVKHDGSASTFEPGKGEQYKANPVRMLFDMQADPWETKNLYGDSGYDAAVAEHEAMLREWERLLIPGEHFDRGQPHV